MSKGRVQGKAALVTGGSSGIGAETAALLAKEGARVVITDIREPESPGDLTFIAHDISREESWDDVMKRTLSLHGTLDILVNCAGINGALFGVPQDPEHISIEQFRRVMAVNAEGTLLGCRFAIAAMKERGGSIVNVGSLSSILPTPAFADYGSSKAVIRYLTKTVALDCLRKGYRIRCNSVTPGAIYTPLWDSLFVAGEDRLMQENEVRERIPMKEWGMPEDIAYAILYLASDEAKHVTGADIIVDGGQYLSGQVARGR
jgi:NAD(P)-dependent dehydrogenase (short-subunit alcohol dehydrogenase family)